MDKAKRREYARKYYEEHRIAICERTIGKQCEESINRAYMTNETKIRKMYERYPYEEYGEKCFKRLRRKFLLKRNHIIHDECYDVSMKAYMYTICKCSFKEDTENLIRAYLYKMMRIYIICVLNLYNHERKQMYLLVKSRELKTETLFQVS